MTQENKEAFVTYAFTGQYNEKETMELLNCEEELIKESPLTKANEDIYRIGRQYYLFLQLLDDTNGIKTKNLKFYLQQLQKEMEHQYVRKSQMENRSGFVFALWGLLTIFVLEKMVIDIGFSYNTIVKIICLAALCVSGLISLVFMMSTMLSKSIRFYMPKNRWNDFYSAMEHQEMAIVRFVEGNKNAFEVNEKILDKTGSRLNVSVILEVIYVYCILINIFIQRC